MPAVRGDLLRLWVDATNAGGSIGFVAPVTNDDVAPLLDASLARVSDGPDDLGVLRDCSRHVVAMAFLTARPGSLSAHWRTVLRVAVHPSLQGQGAGRRLMTGLHDLARSLGLEHLQLTVRDGNGLEGFYGRLGYRVVGRHPGSVRVAPGDDRDEIMMVCPL
ncbi:MAG TPA: GNAT family N-acetyltransferase [Nocardioidaceae bacterium]|nr:GNAT family N-acetyltransferase [Nocardioidaceae bacterium]